MNDEDRDLLSGHIDEITLYLIEIIKKISVASKQNNKPYFIGGGFAIELSVGKITRNHHDIDFHPVIEDYIWWKNWFVNQGYTIDEPASDDFPDTCHIENEKYGILVDLWPVILKDGETFVTYQNQVVKANRFWSEICNVLFEGHEITIENPSRVLEQKIREAKGKENLRPQDIHDFKILHS